MSIRRPRLVGATALLAVSTLLLAGCDGDQLTGTSAAADGQPAAGSGASTSSDPFRLTTSIARGAVGVPVDSEVDVAVSGGTIGAVRVRSAAGPIAGELDSAATRWTATDRLEPGTSYTVRVVGEQATGETFTRTSRFTTQDLSLDEQTYASVAPLDGETVGVGMPVIVTFDLPVTDRAAFEQHMDVASTTAQRGSWHWVSDTEAHWRPKTYWKPGTEVHVDIDVNGVAAGGGIYGQESREIDFVVGDAHISRVDMDTHQMKVFSNGKLLRTIPITTGEQPAYTTRSGVKVIMEKFESKDMNSETVGITGADAYNISGVKWAMRLTHSGEFIHAAPWSVGSQGHANVSHGCTGMSTEDAGWLYAMSRRGDVVEYTGSDRPMTLTNGYGDWNASFAKYQRGSAL